MANFKDLFPVIVIDVMRQDIKFRESVVDMQVTFVSRRLALMH